MKKALSEMSEKELKWLGSATQYDNLHLSDVYDRSKDAQHKGMIQKHIEENNFLIQRIRFELASRKEV